ncbi:response regulator transcription factor [Chryseobacterium sp.]|uniref:response regulator n=1 Tax=Chryseobacterium sp. TaxID=1871047 RepID=UPI0035B3651C
MENEKINIIIVDDHPIVIEGLRMMLKSQPFFNVAGSFTTGGETLDFIRSQTVDIILLDITLPDGNGTELCREIKKISPNTSLCSVTAQKGVLLCSLYKTEQVVIFLKILLLMSL